MGVLCWHNTMKLSLLFGFIFVLSLFEPVPAASITSICENLNRIIGTNGKQSGLHKTIARICMNRNSGPINNGYKAKNFEWSENLGPWTKKLTLE